MNGFIFVGHDGSYAVERANTGFGSQAQVVDWTKDINQATVFRNHQPWGGCMGRHLESLKHAQPLQASVSRVVTIGVWKKGEPGNGQKD